ncbi:hypothetical protein PDE_09539 [Penicillium oxalicum 114-2]|uniref:Uncharacterized protein n=1 Tax=Penicillium oxalicum (strain 114-2 / CGMCC 5302) TaxID=933388 RepID=S7ZV01_PENO1|nr:hypothetical protein PDE_09539 [Penicillium oxalicum 114-2]
MTHSSSDLKHFALQIQQVRFSNLKEPCLWVAIMATQSTESSFLVGLVGTEIATEVKPELQLPTKTWVTSERIEELSLVVTQQAIDLGYKPGFAAAKFFCYSKDNPSQETAFMRCLPTNSSLWDRMDPILHVPSFLNCSDTKKNCKAMMDLFREGLPSQSSGRRFLGFLYRESTSGILISTIVKLFARNFAMHMTKSVTVSGLSYHFMSSTWCSRFSGFRMAVPIDTVPEWSPTNFVAYGLAKASHWTDWYKDESGWEF